MNLQVIRKYRIQFESWPIFNDNSFGIALFDLATAFIGAWILDISFNLQKQTVRLLFASDSSWNNCTSYYCSRTIWMETFPK